MKDFVSNQFSILTKALANVDYQCGEIYPTLLRGRLIELRLVAEQFLSTEEQEEFNFSKYLE